MNSSGRTNPAGIASCAPPWKISKMVHSNWTESPIVISAAIRTVFRLALFERQHVVDVVEAFRRAGSTASMTPSPPITTSILMKRGTNYASKR